MRALNAEAKLFFPGRGLVTPERERSRRGKTPLDRSTNPFVSKDEDVPFVGDDDAACVAKMARGEPLTDQDRHDWLIRVHRLVREWSDGTLVIACSALKQSYRRLIARGESCVGPSHGATVKFVLLHTSRETVMRRLAARRNHFFKGSALLVDAQYDALEMSDELLIVQVDDDVAGGTAETTRRVLELL